MGNKKKRAFSFDSEHVSMFDVVAPGQWDVVAPEDMKGPPSGIVCDGSLVKPKDFTWKHGYYYGTGEFRAYDTRSGLFVVESELYHHSTINIMEYLAIGRAMQHLHEQGDGDTPVWSDSQVAICWVRWDNFKTKLPLNDATRKSIMDGFAMQRWLLENKPTNPLRFWSVKRFGPNPADYGRK